MSKYGFSLSIMLLELSLVFGLFLYLGRMASILWVILLIFMSMATIVAIVNRSMTPDSKVMWLVVTFVPVIGPLLYLMFGERRLSKKEIKQLDKLGSMHFREDNSKALRQKLKEEDKAAYGVIKSLLSMDSNATSIIEPIHNFFSQVKVCGNICWKTSRKLKSLSF